MNLRDALFVLGSMPKEEAEDLFIALAALTVAEKRMLLAYVTKLLSDIDLEEALEKHAAAEAAVELKKIQYGVGP